MKLPVEKIISACEFEPKKANIIRKAFTNRGLSKEEKRNGIAKLRASKPNAKVESFVDGCANYVHRWLQFDLGTNMHMPCTDVFDLYSAYDAEYGQPTDSNGKTDRFDCCKQLGWELDSLVKRFMSFIPVEMQQGTMQWGRALGIIR